MAEKLKTNIHGTPGLRWHINVLVCVCKEQERSGVLSPGSNNNTKGMK